MRGSPWFVVPKPRAQPAARVFGFPYAGASATIFHRWPQGLGPRVEVVGVQLPGRTLRFAEAALRSMDALISALVPAVLPRLDAPYVFFGHSFGALVAFELTRALARWGAPPPACLIVSAKAAPHVTSKRRPMHDLSRAAFVEELKRRYDPPDAFLNHPQLLDLALPALRADFEIIERYVHVPAPPLDVPIVALAGRRDQGVALEDVSSWRAHTAVSFELHMVDGAHFFVDEAREEVIARVVATLGGLGLGSQP